MNVELEANEEEPKRNKLRLGKIRAEIEDAKWEWRNRFN